MKIKHGFAVTYKNRTRLYATWNGLRQRCNNPKNDAYKNYGLRGIEVCSDWDDFVKFYNWAIQSGYNDNLTIDRIDNDKGYYPENCRFVSKSDNNKNKRKRKDWGIYSVRNGYSVLITFNNTYNYGGYTKNIEIARSLRDNLASKLK